MAFVQNRLENYNSQNMVDSLRLVRSAEDSPAKRKIMKGLAEVLNKASEDLIREALKLGSQDNISCIVVLL